MKHLCDTNILIALTVESHIHHKRAKDWFYKMDRKDTVVICRATQTSFLRLLTYKIAPDFIPLTNQLAWHAYELLLSDEAVSFLKEPSGVNAVWGKLASTKNVSPNLWMDAYLAAFAICGNMKLATLDNDFKQFEPHGLGLVHLKD